MLARRSLAVLNSTPPHHSQCYYNLMHLQYALSLLPLLATLAASASPLDTLGASSSGSSILYSQSSPMPLNTPTQFTTTYATPKTTNPKLIVALVGYEDRGDMSAAVMRIVINTNAITFFTLNVTVGGSTLLYSVTVSYVSVIDDYGAVFPLYIYFNAFTNVSTGTGDRTSSRPITFYLETNRAISNTAQAKAHSFINGFEIQAPSGFVRLYTQLSILNSISLMAVFKTELDCRVIAVQGLFLIIDTALMVAPPALVFSQLVNFTNDTTSMPYPSYYGELGNSLVGLSSLRCQNTKTTGATVSFTFFNTSSTLNTNLNTFVVKLLSFTYIYLARRACPTSAPYFTSASNSTCTSQCPLAQVQSPLSLICGPCILPCLECSLVPGNCTSCLSGYTLAGNTCNEITVVCPIGQTQQPMALVCEVCSSPCSECYGIRTNCTACVTGYELVSSTGCQLVASNSTNSNTNNGTSTVTEATTVDSKLYLLSLLALLIVVPIPFIYFYLKRRRLKLSIEQFTAQPAIIV